MMSLDDGTQDLLTVGREFAFAQLSTLGVPVYLLQTRYLLIWSHHSENKRRLVEVINEADANVLSGGFVFEILGN